MRKRLHAFFMARTTPYGYSIVLCRFRSSRTPARPQCAEKNVMPHGRNRSVCYTRTAESALIELRPMRALVAIACLACALPANAYVHAVGRPSRPDVRTAPAALALPAIQRPRHQGAVMQTDGGQDGDYFIPVFVAVALGGYGLILALDAIQNGVCLLGTCWGVSTAPTVWGS